MKALVTGSSGFIGSRLVERLREMGWEVETLDIKEFDEPVEHYFSENKNDYVFHLAAFSRVQPSFKAPTACFEANVLGTQNICSYAMHHGAKLIYAGSSSKHHNPHTSPYACTKWLGEEVIKMYKEVYGLQAEIARFYNVYGPGELLDTKDGNVIGIWRKKIMDGDACQIVGDGEQRRDFTHVDDIVDGLIRIATSIEEHEDAWELGTGVNYSVNELAFMFKLSFPNAQFEYIPDQAGNYRETLNTNTDAADRLGWEASDQLKQHIDGLQYSHSQL